MNVVETEAYRVAFAQYLRKGTPIGLSLKQAGLTGRYVWRTRRDERVRPSHRRNAGRIFRWTDAPETGHPSEDYNCRCVAVPYVEGRTEFAMHDIITNLASPGRRWNSLDMFWHFLTEDRVVTLREIGHLRELVEQYAFRDGVEGAFRRLSDQIADAARDKGPGPVSYPFRDTYDFDDVAYAHGDATVRGEFNGTAQDAGAMLQIEGRIHFRFHDIFTDPLEMREIAASMKESPDRLLRLLESVGARVGLGDGPDGPKPQIDEDDVSEIFMAISDLGQTTYEITGEWETSFRADALKDRSKSQYWDIRHGVP